MATTHSQSVMQGYTHADNTAGLITGHTDAVATPSGSDTSNADGQHAMKYRGMENLWGNYHEYVDGIRFYGADIYVCSDPSAYNSNSGVPVAPYFKAGKRNLLNGGWVASLAPLDKNPTLLYPSTAAWQSTPQYYCCKKRTWTAEPLADLTVGGMWNLSTAGGLWQYDEWIQWWGVPSTTRTSRLCFKPIDGAELA